MPNRIIRDGLLDSPRYWSVTIEARQLFIHLMLCADDFGLVSLAPVFVRRRCFDDAPSQVKIDKLIEQLIDADLIRAYGDQTQNSAGQYAFIPKFGQRLRLMRCKHPIPPTALFQDDEYAKIKFNENKDKFAKPPDTRRTHGGHTSGTRRPEVEVEVKGNEKEVEVKGIPLPPVADAASPKGAAASPTTALKETLKVNPMRAPVELGPMAKAISLGLKQMDGETPTAFVGRINSEWDRRSIASVSTS